MRALIADDNFAGRLLLKSLLSPYFDIDVAVNGKETIDAYNFANYEGKPFDVIFLDIMMPEMDGQEALVEIRKIEASLKVKPKDEIKVIMITALDSPGDVVESYYNGNCTSYLVKPIEKNKLMDELKNLGLI